MSWWTSTLWIAFSGNTILNYSTLDKVCWASALIVSWLDLLKIHFTACPEQASHVGLSKGHCRSSVELLLALQVSRWHLRRFWPIIQTGQNKMQIPGWSRPTFLILHSPSTPTEILVGERNLLLPLLPFLRKPCVWLGTLPFSHPPLAFKRLTLICVCRHLCKIWTVMIKFVGLELPQSIFWGSVVKVVKTLPMDNGKIG